MDPVERLVAYLDDELEPSERTALEAELARDAVLRSTLTALRRADAALSHVTTPEPGPAFTSRLDDTVTEVLGEVLGEAFGDEDASAAPAQRAGPTGASDELASRRARRRERSRWLPATVGIAAAALLVVGGGVVLTGVLGGADGEADHADAGLATLDAPDSDVAASAESAGTGPTIVATGRSLTDALIDELHTTPQIIELRDRQLGVDDGRALAADHLAMLGADAPSERPADEAVPEELPEADVGDDAVSDADATDAARCVEEILTGGAEAIPVTIELARYGGVEAVVVAVLTVDPATERYTRTETWVLARDTCRLLRFSQG